MTCAACSARLERVLNAQPGVETAWVNLARETARIRYRAGESNPDTLIAAVTACVKARLLYERGELATALELAAQALPVGRTCGLLDFVWLGLEVLLPATVHAQDAPPP